ncbi:AAA family ATPase [Microcoleus sp.]|uniref:AAA family ATPase n=2 Tax=Microcoleus sp. TaxID=44472 RepID=UPI003523571B
MTGNSLPSKISTPRRLGDSYELRLFALSCLKMVSDLSIEHVRHEDSSATPADDVIIEFKDRIECFQAKHAMNPHALLNFEHDSGILFDTEIDEKKFKIEFLKLYEVWKLLQSRNGGKEIVIRIFTNRAAGHNLAPLLDGDHFHNDFLTGELQNKKKIYTKFKEAINLDSNHSVAFLSCIRFDLRQPNEEQLDKLIRVDWLQRRFGLTSSSVYGRFLAHAERWYLERRSRPIYRDEILEALQIDNSTLPQKFPVDLKTYVARPDFEQKVLKVLFRDESTYTAIVGTPGSGKSTFITRFTDELRRRGQPIIRYYAFAKVNDPFERERVTAQAFLKSMIEQLCQEFRDLIPDERRYEYSESRLNELLTLLGSHFKLRGQQLLMVVDGIDHVGRAEIEKTQKLLNVLPVQLPAGVICLIGTQSTEYLPSIIEEQCREALVSIPLFEIQQTGYFLNRYFDTSSRPRQNTIDVIHKRSEGLPLYLYFIAERLRQVPVEEYDDLVEKLPPYEGDINSYYIALWSEFSREHKLKKLCGLAARLHFRVQVSDLLSMAEVNDAFEGEPLFNRMKHLMQVSDAGCRVFHNSFRDFIRTKLLPEQLQQLDASILFSYLDQQRNQLLWFMYAHRYAEAAKAYSYLMENYGQGYISDAIRRGRPHAEIIEALQATARAAISECNLVVTARTAALLSHTQERLENNLDRSQLWRTLLSMGEINDALAAFAQEREVYDLSTETAQIIVHLAERGEYEFGSVLAQDFLEKLPRQIERGDYTVAVGELISIYVPHAAVTLTQWIGEEPEPDTNLPYGRVDLGTALLPKALKNLYTFKRWDVLRILRKLLPLQPGWEARRDRWLLETIKLETEFRPDTVSYHIRKAARHIQKQDERILLAGHVAQHDLGADIVEKLLECIILHPQLERESSFSLRSQEFEVFRAYVAGLEYLGRYNELQVLDNFLKTSDSSIAAYYRVCYAVSTSKNQPEKLLYALTHFAEHECRGGEYMFDIQRAVTGDLTSLLKDVVNRYILSGGEVNLLLDRFHYASEGKTFSIPKITGLQVLSAFSEIRGHLQSLLVEIHEHIFNTEFETESRTNELLSLAELASLCGHFNLGRVWLQEAVLALKGYGYRKDYTVSLLIEALEEISSLQPELLQQRVADIAEWNLLMPKVTEDGKGIRWFPISLYNTALRFNSEIARELLLTYYNHVAKWKFSDVLASFLRSYDGRNLVLAYTLSELIHEEGTGYEDSYKDKFETRFHLLKAAVAQGNQTIVHWVAKRIRQFLLTEVSPTERLSFVETFNKYVREINLLPIQTCSTYPKRDKNTSSVELEIPECIELDGEKILTDTLADKLSVSFEKLSHGVEQLLEKYSAYRLRSPIHQSIKQLVQKIRAISELDRLAHYVQNNEEIAKEVDFLLARGYLNLGRSDKAAEYYKEGFMLKNKFELWNPQMEEFKQLAEIKPDEAFHTLFEFIDRHLKDYSWGGETTFLLFLKGALNLGENYRQSAIELYEAFHEFIQNQFEHLPTNSPSPYEWLREPNYQIRSFEEIAQKLIEQAWSAPLLHCRQHLVHLLKDIALSQPTLAIPWLVSLLQHKDYTLNTQSALVIASIALDRPDMLIDHVDALIAALDTPHTERVYYLKKTLEAIANHFEDNTRILEKLKSLRPRIAGTGLVILPDTLRPSSYFQTQTLARTAKSIRETIDTICRSLDFSLDKLHWQIEQEIVAMGFDREKAEKEFEDRSQAYCRDEEWIPFETYDAYYVWHAFNRVLERELQENVVDSSTQMVIDALIRLYDPRFPLSDIDPKPSDINVPFFPKGYGGKELTQEARAWLNFEGEEVLTEQPLEDSWIAVMDKYYQQAGRIVEERFSTAFLASHTLADTILRGDWRVRSGEAVLQLAPEPPYYSLTIDEARSCLERSRTRINDDSFAMIPLVAIHRGKWWQFTSSMLASIAGEWIQRYELSWDGFNSLNLLFSGNPAQKFISWCDGFEVGYSRRKLVGKGNRLLLSKDFLETLMRDYNLCLIVTTWSKRSAYQSSISQENEIEHTKEQEAIFVYRINS